MTERYLFVKLPAARATAEACVALAAEIRRRLPGAAARVGLPADAKARAAWDLAIALADPDPGQLAALEAWLAEQAEVVKAWSFDVS